MKSKKGRVFKDRSNKKVKYDTHQLKSDRKTKTKKNYPYHAAGRVWTIKEIEISTQEDGTQSISQIELEKIHRDISFLLCTSNEILTGIQLDFLCLFTRVRNVQLAKNIERSEASISQWRKGNTKIDLGFSLVLKLYFFSLIFKGEEHINLESLLHASNYKFEKLAIAS